ncbi:ParA family protein [Cobetia sp. D5]|jgi:cellulose biosynthesis protein BcsQ|uniref:ParA family protein n=1 Tax=unclassified Cobetia TaxID=2609414 RepID=UPI000C5432B3|nr:ParA family protein [Cobetia sp. D5]MBF10376.1 cobyrinic acid a,c-diamide synthase [Cobetia sp.]MBR9798130.1 ParA family protein [Gammaproteobacteria bacterium]HBJ28169.1 cobyrinic acid a,c-diamide synthase [Cobetia sp.]|tara:strand:+ start:41573 stop:42637 length:1065 start_codon:yes stop_codon:yes gene_type:complete
MKIAAVYSIKGGVGKTASAINLAHCAANSGLRVLLWDLDPQAAATFYVRTKPKLKGGVEKLISGKQDMSRVIRSTDYQNLDVLPAEFSYRNLDHILEEEKRTRLRKVLKPVRDDYDLVILDCPPSISSLSEQVFASADTLLVPIIPTVLSLRTLEQLNAYLAEIDLDVPVWPFFTLVDRRKTLHKDVMESLKQDYPLQLSGFIPYSSVVERMGIERKPIGTFSRNSSPAVSYRSLWQEIGQRLSLLKEPTVAPAAAKTAEAGSTATAPQGAATGKASAKGEAASKSAAKPASKEASSKPAAKPAGKAASSKKAPSTDKKPASKDSASKDASKDSSKATSKSAAKGKKKGGNLGD